MQLVGFSAYTIEVLLKVNQNYFSACLHDFLREHMTDFKHGHAWITGVTPPPNVS